MPRPENTLHTPVSLSGGKMPRITRPQVYRVVREMLPRERFGPDELLLWLEDT